MSNPLGWDLPAVVTHRMIDGPEMGEETCETCSGKGWVMCDCSEGCKEHVDCPDCKAKGVIEYSVSERRASQRAEAAEAKADMERDER